MSETVSTTKTHPKLQPHFHSMEQQLEASTLGMWVFLVTEVMFFGGLFMAYIVYRNMYPAAWVEASHELNWKLGGLNTGVLICSSITMALAVRAAMMGNRKQQLVNLTLTMALGTTFLVVKYFEYKAKFEHHLPPVGLTGMCGSHAQGVTRICGKEAVQRERERAKNSFGSSMAAPACRLWP